MGRNVDDMIDFFLKEKGEQIIFNDNPFIALIITAKDQINFYDDKYIRIKEDIHTGDIVTLPNREEDYLVVSQVITYKNHKKARLRKCNEEVLKEIPGEKILIGYDGLGRPIYENTDPTLISFKGIIENVAMDIANNQPIVLLQNEILVTVQSNNSSRSHLIEGQSIQVMGRNYTIVGVDKFKTGLLILKCSLIT